MNREQVIALMKILKTAYPRFYANMTRNEAEETINFWQDMFAGDDAVLVTMAVKQLIATSEYPPSIASVKNAMYKMTTQNEISESELWSCIQKAVRNSAYYSNEEFEKLPDICKTYVGTAAQLKEWAISPDYNSGVQQSLFLKQVQILKQREKDSKMLLPEVKRFLTQLDANVSGFLN